MFSISPKKHTYLLTIPAILLTIIIADNGLIVSASTSVIVVINEEERERISTDGQLLGTFFYPWYGGAGEYRHWREAGHTPPATWASNYLPDIDPATFNPARELYDSRDYEVFKWQVAAMKRAGIQFVIVSWWGIGEYEDEVFRLILKDYMKRSDNPYPSLLWAIYYEREGYSDPPLSQLERDIRYILDNYAQDPNYLKVDGKPVIFVYGEGDDTFGYVNRWSAVRERLGVYVVLKVFPGWRSVADRVDSWHQYAPANRYADFSPYSFFVSPGFWKYDTTPWLERDPQAFEEAVALMKASSAKWLLVETWNEYHEGTQIEPATLYRHNHNGNPTPVSSYGYEYVDILARYFGEARESP